MVSDRLLWMHAVGSCHTSPGELISKRVQNAGGGVPTQQVQKYRIGKNYKALRSAGGLRRPLRSLRKEKYAKRTEGR